MSGNWARTATGLVVPGYLGRFRHSQQAEASARPAIGNQPVKLNRADRRRIEREMRKQAKKAARNRKTVGLN